MTKISYLFYQAFLKVSYQKKRYILYVISFYIGLLLPAFCIANIRSVDQVIHATTFAGMEQTVQVDWFSQNFDLIQLDGQADYSISAAYEEDMSDWDHEYVPITGIDEHYFYPPPEVRGRYFSKSELQKGKPVCLLNQRHAEMFGYDIGDTLALRSINYEIIGVMTNNKASGIFIPYRAMAENYQQAERVQFTGTFRPADVADKEQLVTVVTDQIQSNDKDAEILFTTDGAELYYNALATKRDWRVVRSLVAVVAILFFLLNETIVLKAKAEKEQQTIAVNRALGAAERDISLFWFFETLLITSLAAGLVLASLLPIAKLASIESAIVLDTSVAGVFLVLALLTCELLTWGSVRTIRKKPIAAMMKTRDS